MAADRSTVVIKAVIANKKAIVRLDEAVELLEQEADSQPWNTNIKDALKRMKYVKARMVIKVKGLPDERG